MAEIAIVPFETGLYPAYASFARGVWGQDCYQASRSYLAWLYRPARRPAPRPDDFLVARADDKVIGCIHKMRLEWQSGGAIVEVPSLHNWVVDESFRSGLGVMLLTKAMRSDAHAFISSAAGELAKVYRTLRCQEVRASWYRRVLLPVRGAVRLGLHRVLHVSPWVDLPARVALALDARVLRELDVTMSPSERQIASMVALLAGDAGTAAHPHWTNDSFRWRFFDAEGPRHVFIGSRRSGDFMLVAVAAHRGLVVGRVVEIHLATVDGTKHLLRAAERLLKKIGVHVLLGYSAHPAVNARLRAAGWSPLPDAQPSFLHHGRGEAPFGALAVNASAADFGFEAIPTA